MPKTYEILDQDHAIHQRLVEMSRLYHGQLVEARVTISVVLCSNRDADGEEIDPALTHGGYPALATIKINSLKDRAEGKADATITVDGNRWDEWPEAELDAILDHELTHLELVLDDGALVRDDLNRPKLRMRKHDFQMGFFSEVAERHHAAAMETKQLQTVSQWACEHGWLPGFKP